MKRKSLKESLTRWTGFPHIDRSFEPRLTRLAATRVTKLLQDVEPRAPAGFDLQRLYRRVRKEWRRSQSLSQIRPRDLRQLPWALFYPARQDSAGWLGATPSIVEEYGRWLLRGRKTRPVLALLHEFLHEYPTELRTFDELRVLLRKVLTGGALTPAPSLRKWQQRCADFPLLAADGGARFVHDLISTTTTPEETLREAGLDAGLRCCGFLESGIRAALPQWTRLLARGDVHGPRLQRLLALLEDEGKLRFDDRHARAETATALLHPFIDRTPQPATKEALQSFFPRHFGDPRLPFGKQKWAGVPDDVRRVVIRWLVERVLEQFFMLLKETAFDKHWRYREAFWKAFHDEGLIDDIWFVLGSRAASVLQRISSDPAVAETTAKLRGALSDQSVLLMRMPGVTIAEWSHNGSCHIWLDGASGAPALYKQAYHSVDVRRPYPYALVADAHSQRHHGSDIGSWQDEIAGWLRTNTGIEVDRDQYFPRRLRWS